MQFHIHGLWYILETISIRYSIFIPIFLSASLRRSGYWIPFIADRKLLLCRTNVLKNVLLHTGENKLWQQTNCDISSFACAHILGNQLSRFFCLLISGNVGILIYRGRLLHQSSDFNSSVVVPEKNIMDYINLTQFHTDANQLINSAFNSVKPKDIHVTFFCWTLVGHGLLTAGNSIH